MGEKLYIGRYAELVYLTTVFSYSTYSYKGSHPSFIHPGLYSHNLHSLMHSVGATIANKPVPEQFFTKNTFPVTQNVLYLKQFRMATPKKMTLLVHISPPNIYSLSIQVSTNCHKIDMNNGRSTLDGNFRLTIELLSVTFHRAVHTHSYSWIIGQWQRRRQLFC